MHSGWYPDPFTAGMTRWWDGTAWTSYAQSAVPGFDGRPIWRARSAARRASVGLIALAAVAIFGYVITAIFLGHEIRQLVHQIRENIRAANQNLPASHHVFGFAGPQLVL
jgi:hypothetical protein